MQGRLVASRSKWPLQQMMLRMRSIRHSSFNDSKDSLAHTHTRRSPRTAMHLPSDFHVTYLASVVFPRACATRSHPDLDPPQAFGTERLEWRSFRSNFILCVCSARASRGSFPPSRRRSWWSAIARITAPAARKNSALKKAWFLAFDLF